MNELKSHRINLNNNNNNDNNTNNDNNITNIIRGNWLNKLNHILNRFENDNIQLRNINRELESALTDRSFKEGNNIVITKRGRNKNAFHLDDYIKALIATEGKDPYTREPMKIKNLVRVRGGNKRNNYSNLRNLVETERSVETNDENDTFLFTPVEYVVENASEHGVWMDDILELMEKFTVLANGSVEEITLTSDIRNPMMILSYNLKQYHDMMDEALEMDFSFINQRRFMFTSRNLIGKLEDIIGMSPNMSIMNKYDQMIITNYVNTLKSIELPRRVE